MKISTYLAIAGAVLALFGLQCMLVPHFALQQYDFPTEPHNVLQIRTLGVTQLGYGLTLWLARSTRDDTVLRAILLASVPDGHFKILHLWPPKLLQAGRANYRCFEVFMSG